MLYCRSLWLYNFDIDFTLCRPSIFTTSGYSIMDPINQRIDGALSEQLLFAMEPILNIISKPHQDLVDKVEATEFIFRFCQRLTLKSTESRLQIEKHPSLLHHIASELKVAGNHKAVIRWVGLFMVNPGKWIFDSDGDINLGWVQSEFSASIVYLVKNFRNPLVIVCFLFETLRSIHKTSKFAGNLVRDGLVEAAVSKMNAVGSSSLQKILLIDMILSVHRLSVANMKSVWEADHMLRVMRQVIVAATEEVGLVGWDPSWQEEYGDCTIHSNILGYIRKYRSQSAWIARQLDMTVHHLCAALGKEITWDYILFADVEPRRVCSRSMYASDNRLL